MSQTVKYVFLLSALLIGVAYFAGLSTDLNAFSAGATRLIYAVTGRDASGKFAAYPTGGPSKIQSF